MTRHGNDTPSIPDDAALKDRFDISRDLHRIWIRYIEKAAEHGEWKLANDLAICLMNSEINSFGRLLAMSISQLRMIKRFSSSHEELLLILLSRIAKDPKLARPVYNNPFNRFK